jgi:hypothetical protein
MGCRRISAGQTGGQTLDRLDRRWTETGGQTLHRTLDLTRASIEFYGGELCLMGTCTSVLEDRLTWWYTCCDTDSYVCFPRIRSDEPLVVRFVRLHRLVIP